MMKLPSVAPLRNVHALSELVQSMSSAPMGQERMACFHGPSGWGKTSAAGVAEITHNAVVVEVLENVTKRFFMQKLCSLLGCSDKGSIPDMIQRVANQLVRDPRPLIIDDAQYLMKSRDMIGMVRDIYNGTSRLLPVILIGEEELPSRLTLVENVHNRISSWIGAEPCNMADAKLLVSIYAPGINVDEALLSEIVTASGGAIRRVSNNLLTVRELSQKLGRDHLTKKDWGDRSFFDGSVPARRDLSSLKPKVNLVSGQPRRMAQ